MDFGLSHRSFCLCATASVTRMIWPSRLFVLVTKTFYISEEELTGLSSVMPKGRIPCITHHSRAHSRQTTATVGFFYLARAPSSFSTVASKTTLQITIPAAHVRIDVTSWRSGGRCSFLQGHFSRGHQAARVTLPCHPHLNNLISTLFNRRKPSRGVQPPPRVYIDDFLTLERDVSNVPSGG